ncbi:hypothetical protein [Dyadobacter fermentans]|uniref:hypothetical protein n=1 Tax=Dyadobacter fermentans TaxID=94254 RepID=UPI001CC16EA4|nr:hypothetical protein [Dyadobacter fermentans]MBZ1362136.1 hypothetical protein [Dyadobacter fermentans]
MGISPKDLKDITPYEFNLLREGYYKQREFDSNERWRLARFQAHTTYAMIAGALGNTPDEIMDWFPLPTDEAAKEQRAKLKSERLIDLDYKREMEAKMNAIK